MSEDPAAHDKMMVDKVFNLINGNGYKEADEYLEKKGYSAFERDAILGYVLYLQESRRDKRKNSEETKLIGLGIVIGIIITYFFLRH